MLPPEFVVRADLARAGVDRPDRDRTAPFNRARRGVYLPARIEPTPPLDADARYLRQVAASSLTLTGETIYSHESAAVLLGLPMLGEWPDVIHLIAERRSGGRSQLDVARHCLGLEDIPVVVVEGRAVTSPARTVLDIALTRGFEVAIVVADAAFRLHPGTREAYAELVERYGRKPRFRRAMRVLEFADARSGSVGESLSRALMELAGFERPDLQVRVTTDGRDEFSDFGWLRVRTLGEFDGETKYRTDRYRRGGSVEDVVIREKNRENRMRVQWPSIARWDWADLHQGRLSRILLRAGVPRRPR